MPTRDGTSAELQSGTVARLELAAGFGYVRNATGDHNYIFIVGKAKTHAQVRKLAVGAPVSFSVSRQVHVNGIVAA
jgi:cold shock CspA family protein